LATDEVQAAPGAAEATSEHLTRSDRAKLFRYMLMMRASEERALTLYRQGKVPGSFYDGRGQEAISVGSSFVLGPRDRMCILHRDLGAHFVRGVTPDRYLANYMGRADGVTGGKDGNMHFGDRRVGCVGMVSMLPDMAQVATGMALAFKMRREPRVAMTYFGEGATANGQCHEALNFAGIHRLPIVFILENNRFAYSTPTELEFAVDPVVRAEGYGFPGMSVDGNDVEAVFEASRVAVERARAGGGPTLIECLTMRMHGHGAHDDMSYVPKELLEEWERRDPIDRYASRLVADHGFSAEELDEIRESVRRQVEECAAIALESPMPEPHVALEGVFAEQSEPLGDGQAPWSRWSEGSSAGSDVATRKSWLGLHPQGETSSPGLTRADGGPLEGGAGPGSTKRPSPPTDNGAKGVS
jgi:TPP-dependent pyruvate/acetoin dehydrogenase alpha subunit